MKRRQFVTATGAALLAPLVGCGGGGGTDGLAPSTLIPGGGTPSAAPPLPVLPLMAGGNFALNLQQGSAAFLAGLSTPTYGINGNYLGPTLRMRRGENAAFAVTNSLSEPAAIHWHGLHIPAAMDGGPHQTIAPGGTWRPSFNVRQAGGTFWYHAHTAGETGRQVTMGLAGMIVIDDDNMDALDLPHTWGDDDIPLVVQDRRFHADGRFAYLSNAMPDIIGGMMGDRILVNGAITPRASVPAKEVRFRLLNGANARVFRFAFAGQRTFQVIASDGGLLEAPVAATTLTLSPGERAEIVVDFTADAGRTLTLNDIASGLRVLEIGIDRAAGRVTHVPARLAIAPRADEATALRTRDFVFGMTMGGGMGGMGMAGTMGMGFTINGRIFDMNRIDETMRLDEPEIWRVRNVDPGMTHSMHIHGGTFLLLDRNGSAANLAPHERGLKDTVLLSGGDTVRLLLTMRDYPTATGTPYMYHCHILEHEDGGMMGQVGVTT